MLDKFLSNASRAWTNAKVQIKSNFESIADNAGLKKLNISDEYDLADWNYEDITMKISATSRTFNQLMSNIKDYLNSLVELSCILVDSFMQEEVEEYNAALCLHQRALQIKAYIMHTTLIQISKLNEHYIRLSAEGRNISSIRNNVKSNYTKYMNYSHEFDKKITEQRSHRSTSEIEQKMSEHETNFKQSLSFFLSEVKQYQMKYLLVSKNIFTEFEYAYSGFLKTVSSIITQKIELQKPNLYEEDEDEETFIEVDTDSLN